MHIMDKQVVRAPRRRREHSEEFKRELVARSLEPGVSVAAIAMDSGINANLLFGWRRRHLRSLAQAEPAPAPARSRAAVLLPVSIEAGSCEIHSAAPAPPARSGSGVIEIDIGGARVRAAWRVDEASVRCVLHGAAQPRMIGLPSGTRVWLVAGHTDMRKGFDGLAALVQTALAENPFCGHVFVFRGRRGDILKVLWFDGQGLMLLAKRLERGRFVWPQATAGACR